MHDHVAFMIKTELQGDPLGRDVERVDDRDQSSYAEPIPGKITAGGRGFGGETAALKMGADVVAELDLGVP